MKGFCNAAPILTIILITTVVISGCAKGITSDFDKPKVNVTSFDVDPNSKGMTPTFLIGLKVVNPNRVSLPLEGIVYTVKVEGEEVFTGAKGDLPSIPAYGTKELSLPVTPNLVGSFNLAKKLMMGKSTKLHYQVDGKLDLGTLLPTVPIKETGEFNLTDLKGS